MGFFLGCACLNIYWRALTSAGGGELIVIWLSGCTIIHPVQCFPFMFWLQHFSHKIEEWQKGVLIVMWACWCTQHTLRGAFPGLSLPQPWLEDLTNAGGLELIVIWLSGCTMVHPAQCFPFMFWLQHFSYEIEEWQKGVLIAMWTCEGGELTVIWLSGCTMVHPVQCFPFMFWLQHFSHKIEEWQKGVLIVMWTCWCTKHTHCAVLFLGCACLNIYGRTLPVREGGN